MEYRHAINNRRKLKKKPTIALVVIVVIAILLGGIFWFINREGPYDKYKVYNKDNKKFGTVEHYEKDDDSFFISLYYPKTKNSNLDKIVKDYQENYVKEQKINKNSKDILYMDYSINEVYNQFINLKFKTIRYDEDDKVVETKEKLFTYDTKKEKILTVGDSLRNTFKTVLASSQGIDKVDAKSNNLTVEKDKLIIYTTEDLKNKIEVNYKDNKELIKLANKNIPSDAPLDVAGPAAQPEVDPNKKMIAFTLDDGPHKTNTLKVVEMFEKYNGRATFFELGKNITLYPDVVKTVYEHGFEIASHSWDHPDLRKFDAEGLNKQIVDTQNAIYKITGAEPTLIRPPYGAFNDNVKSVVKNNGMEIALWSVDTLDWKLKDANKIKETIINNSYDGAVVLLHDIHNFSVEGLEMALGELYNRGYQFVTLDTLKQYKDLKTVFR